MVKSNELFRETLELIKEKNINFYNFLNNNNVEFIDEYPDSKEIVVDCYPNGIWLTVYIPVKLDDKIMVRLSYISTEEEVKECLNDIEDKNKREEIYREFINKHKEVEDNARELGYRFVLSHGTGDVGWGYWDIIFDLEDFRDEERMKLLIDSVDEADKYISNMRDTYKV